MEGGGSGVAAARVGRASGAGFSVYGGPAFDPMLPDVRLLVLPGRLPKTPAPGIAYGATLKGERVREESCRMTNFRESTTSWVRRLVYCTGVGRK